MSDYNLRELIDAWRSLKLSVDEKTKEFEDSVKEDKLAISLLEENIRSDLHEKGISSVRISGPDVPDHLAGTAYLSKRVGSKVEDSSKFFEYVIKTGRTELLFARASDTAVAQFVEEEKQPPPGITIQTTEKLNFRKSS